jgi:flagellar hook-associated protein 2
VLAADGGLRGIATRLKNLLTESFDVTGNYNSLTRLGITSTRAGGVELKSTTLDAAISANFEGLVSMFTDTTGFASKLKTVINNVTGANGIVPSRNESLTAEVKRIGKERQSLSIRVKSLETRLRNQYAALDSLTAKFKGTSSFIAQSLAKTSQS